MKLGKSGEIYNVGSGYPTRIYELLISILRKNGISLDAFDTNNNVGVENKSDVGIIYADISKIKELGRFPKADHSGQLNSH